MYRCSEILLAFPDSRDNKSALTTSRNTVPKKEKKVDINKM